MAFSLVKLSTYLYFAIHIASEMCIYTNDQFTVESLAVVEENEKNNNELSKE